MSSIACSRILRPSENSNALEERTIMPSTKKAPKTIAGVTLEQVKPAMVVNNKFVAIEAPGMPVPPKLKAIGVTTPPAKYPPVIPPPIAMTPGGNAFVATAKAFGKKSTQINIAALNDGTIRSVFHVQEENFQFEMLFQNFKCTNSELFIFDDVKIIPKKDKAGSRIIFSGILRMKNELLKPFQKFIGGDQGLLLGGEIEIGDQDISEKLKPTGITLTSAAKFHVALSEEIIFSDLELKVKIVKSSNQKAGATNWECKPTLIGSLDLAHLSNEVLNLQCAVSYENKTLHVDAGVDEASGLFGISHLTLNDLKANFDIGRQKRIELKTNFSPSDTTYELSGVLTSKYAGAFSSISKFSMQDLADIYHKATGLPLGRPDFDVTFKDVTLGMATADCKVNGQALAEGITLTGTVNVHGRRCTAQAHISAGGVSFTGRLDDFVVGPVSIKKARLEIQFYSAASGKPSEFAVVGQARIKGVQVECKLVYEKIKDRWNPMLYAALEASSFGLGNVIIPAKGSFLDSLKFSKVAFIYAQSEGDTQDPDFEFSVKKGLQLIGVLEEIPALTDLTGNKQIGMVLSAHLGSTTDIGISLPDTRLSLGSSVTCNPFEIEIILQPKPEFNLIFSMDVTAPKQKLPLHFNVKLEISFIDASGSGTMKNYWVTPFGIKGLKIGPQLALEVGIIYEQFLVTGVPSKIGFAGGLALGEVIANMAVQISEIPTEEILWGRLEKLTPSNLVKFAEDVSSLKLPDNTVPDFFELNDLEIYCAPTGGSIGTVTFDPGISFACDLVLFGKKASSYVRISDQGAIAKGNLDRLEVGPLKVTGKKGKHAELDLELTSAKQSISIDGEIEILGSREGLFVDISNQGIFFQFEQSFLGLLTFQVNGKSKGSLSKPASLDFILHAEFDNEITEFLKNEVAQKIHTAIHAAEAGIEKAQKEVDNAEKEYKKEFDKAKKELDKAEDAAKILLRQIEHQVNIEKGKYDQALRKAKSEVEKAERVYDRAFDDARKKLSTAQSDYDTAMRKARDQVSKAQRDYDAAMNQAQNAVNDAKNKFSNAMRSAESQVRAARNSLNSLKQKRDSAVRKLKRIKWYEFHKAIYLPAEIAGLETAMIAAQGALYAAEGVLKAVQAGVEYSAFEGAKAALEAVRYGVEYGVLETAKTTLDATRIGGEYAALEAAKRTISAVKIGIEYTAWQGAIQTLNVVQTTGRAALDAAILSLETIEETSVYIALESAKLALELVKQGTAAAAFESAKAALEGAKQGSKAMLSLAEYVAKHAGDLFDVKHIKLSSRLKAIERGELFKAEVDIAVLSKPYHWKIDLDVSEPSKFIEALLKNTLREAKEIVA